MQLAQLMRPPCMRHLCLSLTTTLPVKESEVREGIRYWNLEHDLSQASCGWVLHHLSLSLSFQADLTLKINVMLSLLK